VSEPARQLDFAAVSRLVACDAVTLSERYLTVDRTKLVHAVTVADASNGATSTSVQVELKSAHQIALVEPHLPCRYFASRRGRLHGQGTFVHAFAPGHTWPEQKVWSPAVLRGRHFLRDLPQGGELWTVAQALQHLLDLFRRQTGFAHVKHVIDSLFNPRGVPDVDV
jgi:hypothetical protein